VRVRQDQVAELDPKHIDDPVCIGLRCAPGAASRASTERGWFWRRCSGSNTVPGGATIFHALLILSLPTDPPKPRGGGWRCNAIRDRQRGPKCVCHLSARPSELCEPRPPRGTSDNPGGGAGADPDFCRSPRRPVEQSGTNKKFADAQARSARSDGPARRARSGPIQR